MEQKKIWTPWKVIIGVIIIILFLIFIKIVLPAGSAVVEIEATRNSLNRANSESHLNIESPAEFGKNIHVNYVDMPESGFIVIYRPAGYLSNGQETQKFFGSSSLLPKGPKENFNINLIEEAKCTYLIARLYRDLNRDGKFDIFTEGEGSTANINGEAWIANPNSTIPPPTTIHQSIDVKCR